MSGVNLYSPLNKSAESIPRTKGTGAEFMTELSKKPGFKKAEVEDRGLEALNALPKMTKEQFHAHLHSHPNPQITTKILRDESEKHYAVPHNPDENSNNDLHNVVDEEGRQVNIHPFRNLGEAQSHIQGLEEKDNKTYHKGYKLPGGSNYQEHLYKYDPKDKSQFVANVAHYGGEPNLLASARTVDRNTPEGKKILHVEEIQSDWHQKGRDYGYKQNLTELPKNYKLEERNINNRHEYLITDENGKLFSIGLSPETATNHALDNLNNGKRVPNAPFKKNWEEMVAKQLLKHAVENGYHGIALTPGDEQADRYDLSKQIDSVAVSPTGNGNYRIDAQIKGGGTKTETNLDANGVEEMIGKELASKLITAADARLESTAAMREVLKNGDDAEYNRLRESRKELPPTTMSGLDLKIGGKGMREAYDKRLPNIFNDLGKKHGAKMHLHQIPVFKNSNHYANRSLDGSVFNVMDGNDNIISSHPTQKEANEKSKELNSTKLHYMPLTPELVNHVKKEGIPIYKKGGYVSNDLDTMKYELHMASGGSTLGATMRPSLAQMKFEMSKKFNPLDIQGVGANEAPDLSPKTYINPSETMYGKYVSPGGVSQSNGMPIGGVDQNPQQPGQQLTPQQPGQPPQPPQPGQPQGQQGQGTPPQAPQPTPPMGNMLSLTPEGQAMNAMGGGAPPPQAMAKGGEVEGEMEAPSKTVKAYKLFRVHEKHPGKLFPLFIGKHEPVEMGKWVSAEHIPTKGFAERPGWHAGELPMATHIGERGDPNVTAPTIRPHNQVWTEIEMPHDVDWQSEANRRGTNKQGKVIAREAHITDQVPHGGHYRYKTNPNMTGSWLIGGAMKVNRILSDAEVKKINKAAKSSDLPRKEPFDKKKFGFADGGMAKGGSKIKPPINYPASKPISDKEMMDHAERIVRQMQGIDNPNQRTLQQIARESVLPVDVRHYGSEIKRPSVNYESMKGGQLIGIPGDPSIGGILPKSGDPFENQQASAQLHGIGDKEFETSIPIYGGYKYGAHGNPKGAWAGNISAARGIQNQVKNISKANKGADVYGQYVKMTPQSLDYALHTLDALMEHQQSHKLPNREEIVDLMRNKTLAGHKPMPTFPDMKDIEEVLLHGQLNANMRKKLIHILSTNKYVPTGKENFNDVIHAISHPELRNIETGAGGNAVMKMNPQGSLEISSHPTYSHDIPSELIGQSKYIVPHQVAFPRTHAYAKNVIKKMGKKIVPFNQMKMMGMREPIDEQYINQIGKYEQEMKKRLGYKSGGNVKVHKDMDTMRLELTQRKKAK